MSPYYVDYSVLYRSIPVAKALIFDEVTGKCVGTVTIRHPSSEPSCFLTRSGIGTNETNDPRSRVIEAVQGTSYPSPHARGSAHPRNETRWEPGSRHQTQPSPPPRVTADALPGPATRERGRLQATEAVVCRCGMRSTGRWTRAPATGLPGEVRSGP